MIVPLQGCGSAIACVASGCSLAMDGWSEGTPCLHRHRGREASKVGNEWGDPKHDFEATIPVPTGNEWPVMKSAQEVERERK